MRELVSGTEGKRSEVFSKSTHVFFILLLHDWRVARMRNWVVPEVKELNMLPVTHVLLDPFERVEVSIASSGFHRDHRATDREPPGFCGLSKILTTDWKKKAEVWQEKIVILFASYMAHEDTGTLTWGRPYFIGCHDDRPLFAIDSEIHLLYGDLSSFYSVFLLLLLLLWKLSLKRATVSVRFFSKSLNIAGSY